MNEGRIVACDFLVAGREAAVVLEPVDEPVDEVAALEQAFAIFSGTGAIAAKSDHRRSEHRRWDHRLDATLVYRPNQLVAVIIDVQPAR